MTRESFSSKPLQIQLDATARQVDTVCLEFEDRLREKHPVRIEDELRRVDPSLQADLFRQLLRLTLDYDPDSTTSGMLIKAFPQFRDLVVETFEEHHTLACTSPQPGDRVGRYEIQKKLGEGGFGSVWKAFDSELQRTVALKTPRAGLLRTRRAAQHFLSEAQALASLSHPNIVAVHDVFTDDQGWPFIVMEYLQPCPLNSQPEADTLRQLFTDIAHGLSYSHQQGIIHRDLKSSNILTGSQQQAVIADFGLALQYESAETEEETAGTLQYMSPEQIRGQTHWMDGRSDIWSVGVILYEALCGQSPFSATSHDDVADAILGKSPRPPRQINREVPVDLERICLKCLQKDPEDRYATADDLAAELARKRVPHATRSSRRWKLLAGVQAFGLVVAVILWLTFRAPPAADSSSAAPSDSAVESTAAENKAIETTPAAVTAADDDQQSVQDSDDEPTAFHESFERTVNEEENTLHVNGHSSVRHTKVVREFRSKTQSHNKLPLSGPPLSRLPLGTLPLSGVPQGALPPNSFPQGALPVSSFPRGGLPEVALPPSGFPHSRLPYFDNGRRVKPYPISLEIPKTHQQVTDDTTLKEGDAAIVCWARRWNPVVVQQVDDDLVHIKFDRWNTEYWIPKNNLAVEADPTPSAEKNSADGPEAQPAPEDTSPSAPE